MAKDNPFSKLKKTKITPQEMFTDVSRDSTGSSQGKESNLNLDQIKDRDSDTRDLNQAHVEALASSIGALGLIEPLVVDQDGMLLAGGHRRAAIAYLQEHYLEQYQQNFPDGMVPVRVMEFSAEAEPDRALQIEIAENEQRRDYTSAEVMAIADRLKEAGFTELKGRPKDGDKPLMPALSAVVGKSIRTLQRYLKEPSDNLESATPDVLSEKHLKRAISNLEKWEQSRGRKRKEVELSKHLPEILEKLRAGLN